MVIERAWVIFLSLLWFEKTLAQSPEATANYHARTSAPFEVYFHAGHNEDTILGQILRNGFTSKEWDTLMRAGIVEAQNPTHGRHARFDQPGLFLKPTLHRLPEYGTFAMAVEVYSTESVPEHPNPGPWQYYFGLDARGFPGRIEYQELIYPHWRVEGTFNDPLHYEIVVQDIRVIRRMRHLEMRDLISFYKQYLGYEYHWDSIRLENLHAQREVLDVLGLFLRSPKIKVDQIRRRFRDMPPNFRKLVGAAISRESVLLGSRKMGSQENAQLAFEALKKLRRFNKCNLAF